MSDVTTLLPPEVREAYRQDATRRMWDAAKSLSPLDVSLRRLARARPVNGPPVIPGKNDTGGQR